MRLDKVPFFMFPTIFFRIYERCWKRLDTNLRTTKDGREQTKAIYQVKVENVL